MDAVETVSRRIFADTGDIGCEVLGAAAEGFAAGQIGGGGLKGRQGHSGRIDDQVAGLAQGLVDGKEAQGVTAEETHRPQTVEASLLAVGSHLPAMTGTPLQMADDAAGAMEGHGRKVAHLQPEFGQPPLVAHFETFFKVLADLAAAGAGMAIDMNGAGAVPRPDIAEREDAAQQIGQVESQGAPTVKRKDPGAD